MATQLRLHVIQFRSFSSISTFFFPFNPNRTPSTLSPKPFSYRKHLKVEPLSVVSFALTESDSSKSLNPDARTLLQELADSFVLPSDYFSQLPRDLRLDLNDAAFDLSNGSVIDECGKELGETLLNITRAWELADTSTSSFLMSKLPSMADSLNENNKSALGKRLVSAGRRFQSMGQYGQGELQRAAKGMIRAGSLLDASTTSNVTNGESKQEIRILKFGELQVELTPKKAYSGALIGLVFGVLSWQISRGIASIPESSYANDNADLLAKSLRGALLVMFYSSTVLSAFASIGLLLLSEQLKSKNE